MVLPNLTFHCFTSHFQDMTSHFIYQLSKCSEYIDITEPVQVAIYEIKLGLSLIVSDVLGRSYLSNGEQSMESVLVGRRYLFHLIKSLFVYGSLLWLLVLHQQSTLHKFVRFPRVCASKRVSTNVGRKAQLSINDIEWPTIFEETDLYVLQNMVEFGDTVSTRETSSHAMVGHSFIFGVLFVHLLRHIIYLI